MTRSRTRRRLLAAIGGALAMPRAFAQAATKTRTVGVMTAGGSRFLARTLAKHGWVEGRDVRFEVSRADYAMPAADLDAAELAAWTSVARVVLNLHETITRQ